MTRLVLVSDFETTVYDGQDHTEVWSAAVVELYSEDVHIFHSINEWFDYLTSLNQSMIVYFHNLKFDGEFILSFLMRETDYKEAFLSNEVTHEGKFSTKQYMRRHSFIYSISDKGMFYSLTIKTSKSIIEIRDSYKLLPFTLKKIGESFNTKHQKLEMEYTGYRYAGCPITEEEQEYIKNDVLVLKEALEMMYEQGHTKLTIGSCCLAEFKNSLFYDKAEYDRRFPNLYAIKIPEEEFNAPTMGDYIKRSYHGGWCYVVDGKENQIYSDGVTADVNSLYPSMMHSESGNRYPIGEPQFWIGNYIPNEAKEPNKYYFVRLRTMFAIKPDMLPCIQIKQSSFYRATEWLKTSLIKSRIDGKYHDAYIDLNGKIQPAEVELTLTMTDFELIQEHYYLYNTRVLDGCYFDAEVGIFDEYINKYKRLKMESKGAVREQAKLFLNNLYGKMASTQDSSFKRAILTDDGSLKYITYVANDKTPGYIPIGSAITSYARNFTIRAAQKNYHGLDNPGFIYADTDSIHCNLNPDELIDVPVHPTDFCHWKLEACWDKAIFARQKSYIEHVVMKDMEPVKYSYYNVKCAGMPDKCKDLFIATLPDGFIKTIPDDLYKKEKPFKEQLIKSEQIQQFILDKYGQKGLDYILANDNELEDFKVGLVIPTGKLVPKHYPGGIVLTDISFEMRERFL